MLQITLDTNILVSALIAKGKPRKLVKMIELKKANLVLSNSIIEEFEAVVRRKKFSKYVTLITIIQFANKIKMLSKITTVKSHFKVIKKDPEDDLILNTAYSGKADYIVSGNQHLLKLKRFRNIEIVNTTKMLKILRR